ncbi:MAG: hypothetical protein COA41_11635 [Sphingopyxis sp.]|nr:MAG: hypothetical protein COA41_11635 [Sphingopyxis sp.]
MESEIGYSSQGELLKAAYDAFGILPRKETGGSSFSEKEKKTMQKRLDRLTKEEGELSENYGQLVSSLSYWLTDILPWPALIQAIGDVLSDFQECYTDLLRRDGSYLSKRQTNQYFISTRAVPLLVLGLHRSRLRCSAEVFWMQMPEDRYWFLPDMDEQKGMSLPLSKVMRWAYAKCGVSQTQFHFPGKSPNVENYQLQNNLDNAANWLHNKTLPSLPALLKNFKESFEALADSGRPVPPETQVSLYAALLFSRFSSYVFRELASVYGENYVAGLFAQFRKLDRYMSYETGEFYKEILPALERAPNAEAEHATWQKGVADYWEFFLDKICAVQDELEYAFDREKGEFSPQVIDALKRKFGLFPVEYALHPMQVPRDFEASEKFFALLAQGFELKRRGGLQLEQIDQYEADLKKEAVYAQLDWFADWLRAIFYYRQEDYKAAMPYYRSAFTKAKYRAGGNQYKLVNEYVEVAAKNGKWMWFKQGIAWAQYLSIQIRWLRDEEPTDEALQFVYDMFRRARYAH